jgi:hypothetical protein
MNTQAIIEQIDAEIYRLQQAKVLLNGATSTPTKRAPGRPKVNNEVSKPTAALRVRRLLSVEARAKIAEAQKRRWAKSKRADKKAAKKAVTAKTAKKAVAAKAVKLPTLA